MKIRNEKVFKRERRHQRVRNRVFGTPERPRMCVFKSANHIYIQIVDDTEGRTLAAASSLKVGPVSVEAPVEKENDEKKAGQKGEKGEKGEKGKKGKKPGHVGGKKTAVAREVGKLIADAAKQKGISKVCFDRGGYQYHGRIAALADEARKNGLEF